MNRITSFLALSAIVVAGAFAGTAAQASASNINVNFNVHDADASLSMIRVGSLPTGVSGLIDPAAAILAGNYDPASGNATYSVPPPISGNYVETSLTYANADNQQLNVCTFKIRVTRVSSNSYKMHFTETGVSMHCSVPADVTNADGQFTSTTYALVWST